MRAAPEIFPQRNFFLKFRLVLFPVLFLAFGAVEIFAQRPLGVDVSSYQGSSINWTNVKGSGVSFAWAKATDCLLYTSFARLRVAANAMFRAVKRDQFHVGMRAEKFDDAVELSLIHI